MAFHGPLQPEWTVAKGEVWTNVKGRQSPAEGRTCPDSGLLGSEKGLDPARGIAERVSSSEPYRFIGQELVDDLVRR